jgi:xanthine dehydrogenase accessory factor
MQWAAEKLQLEHYEELKDSISDDPNGFVVIMTFGYRTDDIALRALMHKKFRYIGMLGSKNKVDKLFEEYRQSGIEEALLKKFMHPSAYRSKVRLPRKLL